MNSDERRQLVRSWLHKAGETLEEARALHRIDRLAGALSRTYYAAFYAVQAVLTRDGFPGLRQVKCSTYFDIWPEICVENLEEIDHLHERALYWQRDDSSWISSWLADELRQELEDQVCYR